MSENPLFTVSGVKGGFFIMLTLNDFFCGTGGMGLGFKQAGFEIVGAWDFDQHAVKSYAHNIDGTVKQQDISLLKGSDVPAADVWTFGFPCQDVSFSGLKKGMVKGKTRSGMFYEIMRLLGEVEERPSVILAENVKGVAKYLPEIEKEYNLAGYRLQKTLLDSRFFGVAQGRERYFIAGIREDLNINIQFPVMDAVWIPTIEDILEADVPERFFYTDFEDLAKVKYLKNEFKAGEINQVADLGRYNNDQMNRIYSIKGIAPTALTVSGGGKEIKIMIAPDCIRKMTPREYARLQGFPDSFEIVVSKAQAYKQFGNAVTVPVARSVARSIKEALEG
jgi:DNA (cytosine-5)-methyltransferase 1